MADPSWDAGSSHDRRHTLRHPLAIDRTSRAIHRRREAPAPSGNGGILRPGAESPPRGSWNIEVILDTALY